MEFYAFKKSNVGTLSTPLLKLCRSGKHFIPWLSFGTFCISNHYGKQEIQTRMGKWVLNDRNET